MWYGWLARASLGFSKSRRRRRHWGRVIVIVDVGKGVGEGFDEG